MKKNSIVRAHSRAYDAVRPVKLTYSAYGYAPGSVLLELGDTKVLSSVSMQPNVPVFLKGTRTGWVTAEYAMLPTATQIRTNRENSSLKCNGRSIEISRMIGRALRAVIDLSVLGERTIVVDCDVLQADGSTRTACITAANYALQVAQEYWLKRSMISAPFMRDVVAAISVGIKNDHILLDLDYKEDSSIDADFNVVITGSGLLVEIQGTAEQKAIAWNQFTQVQELAVQGAKQLFLQCDALAPQVVVKENKQRVSLFSLQNR